jgi:hypothetical protein
VANHPTLAGLAERNDAVTVRYITHQPRQKGIGCYCALLEVPAASPEATAPKGGSHVILPIDAATGTVRPFPEPWLHAQTRRSAEAILNRLAGAPLPHWERLAAAARTAHALFPDVHSIAWDFVIAAECPLLLEGNAGWGATVPQLIHGGLLADERSPSFPDIDLGAPRAIHRWSGRGGMDSEEPAAQEQLLFSHGRET